MPAGRKGCKKKKRRTQPKRERTEHQKRARRNLDTTAVLYSTSLRAAPRESEPASQIKGRKQLQPRPRKGPAGCWLLAGRPPRIPMRKTRFKNKHATTCGGGVSHPGLTHRSRTRRTRTASTQNNNRANLNRRKGHQSLKKQTTTLQLDACALLLLPRSTAPRGSGGSRQTHSR